MAFLKSPKDCNIADAGMTVFGSGMMWNVSSCLKKQGDVKQIRQ